MATNLAEWQKKVQITTVEQVYRSYDDPAVAGMFQQVIAMRRLGYGASYPSHFVAVDASDWLDRHYLVGEQRHGDFAPLAGFRITTRSVNQTAHIPFPLTDALAHAGAPSHDRAIHQLINDADKRGQEVQYLSWLTFHPSVRQNPAQSTWLKELAVAILCHEIQTHRSIFLTAAVLQFKTYRWFGQAGYQRIVGEQGEVLSSLRNPFSGLDVDLMVMQQPSRWAEDCVRQHQGLLGRIESRGAKLEQASDRAA